MGNILESVRIVNILSHKDTTIQFHPGVNALVGDSKTGKSNVFKALDWMFNNITSPSWEMYQSYWGGDMLVETRWSNGNVIARGHDNKGNFYELNELNRANKKELRAIGNGAPPQEVVNALNLSDVNFQSQMSSYYLLSNNSGEVARIVNKAVNLDVIDRAVSASEKKKFSIATSLKTTEASVERLSKQLTEFAYLDDMERDVILLEGIETKRTGVQKDISRLTSLRYNIDATDKKMDNISSILKAEQEITAAQKFPEKIDSIRKDIRKLQGISSQLKTGNEKETVLIGIIEAESDIVAARQLQESLRTTSAYVASLRKIRVNIVACDDRLVVIGRELVRVEEAFNAKMPDVCPLCGRSD
jgi:chromosome segregation ATPase